MEGLCTMEEVDFPGKIMADSETQKLEIKELLQEDCPGSQRDH